MAGAEHGTFSCPFCDFVDTDSYFLIQHVELTHPEGGDSPFIVKEFPNEAATGSNDAASRQVEGTHDRISNTTEDYVACPYGCGEQILQTELSMHTDFHMAEQLAIDEVDGFELPDTAEISPGFSKDGLAVKDITNRFTTDLPKALRACKQPSPISKPDRWSFREFLLGSANLPSRKAVKKTLVAKEVQVRRLGTTELGPYAHESQMPIWLHKMLEEGAKVTITNKIGPDGSLVQVEAIANETPDLVQVLGRLSELDPSVERAFYCSTGVRHIAKMKGEGGFCGYRNIQMLVSYIRATSATGEEHFRTKIPSILQLQDMIERAWEMGFNSSGKIETGGIRGTRKYIGTPEAQALFHSLEIPNEANAFATFPNFHGMKGLLLAVAEYFSSDASILDDHKLHITSMPPIYFQHHGHSMTIIGIEVRTNQTLNLVVFDPMFKPSAGIMRLRSYSGDSKAIPTFRIGEPEKLLNAHRRGEAYLKRYKDFEILKLTSPT